MIALSARTLRAADMPLPASVATPHLEDAGLHQAQSSGRIGRPQLSVIVPTLNEAENIGPLVEVVSSALNGLDWEIIFVDDDSRDGTMREIRDIASRDPRVRGLRRIGRRGLSGAVMEGILSSSAGVVAVIDADMQHDEAILPDMLRAISNGADVAIGTRYGAGGSASEGFSALRGAGSQVAVRAARALLGITASDPMSGFFMMRRDLAEHLAPRLSSQGFKILLDMLATSERPLKIAEISYVFRPRVAAQSKLDSRMIWDYAGLLVAKATGDAVSARFLSFALVGLSGLGVHLATLQLALGQAGLAFDAAQLIAAVVAMTWNFMLNNALTYRDRRLSGWNWLGGLLSFYAVCSVGAVANVGVASWVYGNEPVWWLAGAAGAVMGAVFNYSASSAFTWRKA